MLIKLECSQVLMLRQNSCLAASIVETELLNKRRIQKSSAISIWLNNGSTTTFLSHSQLQESTKWNTFCHINTNGMSSTHLHLHRNITFSTEITRPSRMERFKYLMQRSASSKLSIVTKPNPLDSLVRGSTTSRHSSTCRPTAHDQKQ